MSFNNVPPGTTRLLNSTYFLFFKGFIYLFLDRGERREKEGEKHQLVASCTPPTGDLACNPSMYSDWELNQQPLGPQAGAQATEPHEPGPYFHTPFFSTLSSTPSQHLLSFRTIIIYTYTAHQQTPNAYHQRTPGFALCFRHYSVCECSINCCLMNTR